MADLSMIESVSKQELEQAALKAAGFSGPKIDRATVIIALELAKQYGLDIMRRHLVPIDGKPFITRDGLLCIAHQSQQLGGIVVESEEETDVEWIATATVYRKDMEHGFRFRGRYPKSGFNKKYGPEMAVKCAVSMGLRHAFDVAIGAADEMWSHPESPSYAHKVETPVEVHQPPQDDYEREERLAIQAENDPEPVVNVVDETFEVPAQDFYADDPRPLAEMVESAIPQPGGPPICTKCGAHMNERTQRATGSKFWGCSNYPDCKQTQSIT